MASSQKLTHLLLVVGSVMLMCLTAAGASVPDVDAVDTENSDTEAALKCDACELIAKKFSDGFLAAEGSMKSVQLSEQDATEAIEGVCDGPWHGYGTLEEDGVVRLAGPHTARELTEAVEDGENIWSHRLQDLCDELLTEVSSERYLYEQWAAVGEDALHLMLCKGEGTFSACSTKNWGPWPGDDDYQDYDEDDDFDYVHDEF